MLLVVPECSPGGGASERHKFRNWHERFSVNIDLGVRGRTAEELICNMECAYYLCRSSLLLVAKLFPSTV